MGRKRSTTYVLIYFSLVIIIACLYPLQVSGDIIEEEVTIDRFPVEAVFQLENMKPGDIAYRTIAIQNNHDRDILFTIDLENDGNETLFNELLLRIIHLDEIVFYGLLKDYKGVVDRPLAAKTEEVIEFDLKFPEELGNDYQGLRADFHLEFTARAALEESMVDQIVRVGGKSLADRETASKSGLSLPKTASNMYTFLAVGVILLIIGGFTNFVKSKRRKPQE